MKKLALILLALAMLVTPAFALKGEGYPEFGGTIKNNSLGGQFGEENLELMFDSGSEYSYVRDGYIQGCFFAFDEAEEYYLELYLLLPEKLNAGEVLTPESSFKSHADGCSITLFEVDESNAEEAWFAGQLLGEAYPKSSDFAISIDECVYTNDSVAISGKIEAQLCQLENDLPSADVMAVNAQFSFTLPLGNAPAAKTPVQPESKPIVPAFTLPPDHISL